MNYKLKMKLAPLFFIAPFFIIFIAFTAYPVIYSVVLSFGSYKGNNIILSGLKNYKYLLSDGLFYQSILNTFKIMIIQVPLMIILALILAVFLNSKIIRGQGFFRMAIFIPVLIDAVSYSVIFSMFFNDNGIINNTLVRLGIAALPWYTNGFLAKLMIIIASTWKWTGYNAMIIISGLQNIPYELYESASIDGANRIQQFFRITIPQLRYIILLIMITSINGAIQIFTEPNVLTHGGPTNGTTTIMLYLYNIGFKNFNFGVACAGSYILVILVGILTAIQLRAGKEQ